MSSFFIKNIEAFIQLPTVQEFDDLSTGFTRYSSLSGTLLALDGMHICVTKPTYNSVNFVNRHSLTSISFMIACDYRGRIRCLYGPCFGSSHDAFIFSGSKLRDWIQELPTCFHVIGDNAYPRGEHLLVPRVGLLSYEDREYNYKLSAQRNKIECTIGAFKGKFSKFENRLRNEDRDFYKNMIYSCACIHNILIEDD